MSVVHHIFQYRLCTWNINEMKIENELKKIVINAILIFLY